MNNKKIKIEIRNRFTENILFEYEKENNTIKDTVEKAINEGAYLEGAYLRGANLKGANLKGAYLEGANLEGANLEGANLEGANLEGAYLEGANLEGANLKGAYLRGAYLEGANLKGAYLRGVNLKGAYLRGANLKGAYIFLSDDEINQNKVINDFEKNVDLKLTETYINHDVIPTRWNMFWKNGLIIRKYEIVSKTKEIKKMTVSEICKELGYDIEIVKEIESE